MRKTEKLDHAMSQNHFTLSFPLKSSEGAKQLAQQLPPLMPRSFQVEESIGRIHYSHFTALGEETLLLSDFDGEFSQIMTDLAEQVRPLFDAIFQHVENPPLTPVSACRMKWIR